MENSTQALKISIIIQWFLIICAVVFGFYEEKHLPDVLKNYIIDQDSKSLSPSMMVVMSSGILLVIVLSITSIGIYRLKSWARTPYVACSILIAVVFVFMGVTVSLPIKGTLEYMANAMVGFTIALLYFSPARVNFDCSNQSLKDNRCKLRS